LIAIEISRFGGPEVLVPADRPRPVPGADEVLIEVAAAGVNRPDALQRLGGYPPPAGASDIPGLEVAGTVVDVGPGSLTATAFKIGDAVTALVSGGGYAEFCTAPAVQCLPVPRGLDMIASAAIPETTFTVWTNVFDRGRLKSGESILIHGGSSGIGTTAIQLARARGSRVFATAGTAAKCQACERLGAERAFNYRETDFVAAVRDATGGRGVDVVLDIVGGDYLPRNIEVLAVEGRLVQIALQSGSTAQLNMAPMLTKRLTMTASTLRPRPVIEKGAIAAAVRANVWPLFESGAIKPQIFATFPLRAAADAHRLLESGEHIGKIVLVA
jgi:putative PIG3 family NAD(P)H quinone oxidoreductase